MGKIDRSWTLAKASWGVLRDDKELLLLPVISGLCTLVVAITFMVPIYLNSGLASGQATGVEGEATFNMGFVGYGLLFSMYLVLAYVTIFFNTALVIAADERLQGRHTSLGCALKGAGARALDILPWAILSAVVSTVLRAIEQRAGFVGRIVVGLIGIAWALTTFLVLPVMVIERVGAFAAVKRSAELFKRTWGENVAANVAMGLLGFVAVLVAAPVVIAALVTGFAPAIATAIVLAVVWIIGVSIVLAALSVVYQVALYRYATSGVAPVGFEGINFTQAFSPKKK